ncbi:MAG: hypothetical protein ACLP29_14300 [Dissulfurispiraceae bacterium]|jgi:hypothetical protein
MSSEEREAVWDDLYLKEEGIIVDFAPETLTGTIKSRVDGAVFKIDSRELIRTRIELRSGDRILFAPMEDIDGDHFARIIGIVDLNA